MDIPGAEDLKRDSKMDVALGWCCCLEAIEGEREPVPWKSVFCRRDTQISQQMRATVFHHSISKQLKSYNLEMRWILGL